MIKSLTSLRGIFILFIFSHHLGLYSGGGSMAVAFFFVLSGFSMTLGYKERIFKSEFSYKNYIIRRCLKFYPLHWICLLASLPLIVRSISFKNLGLFIINATLLQTWIPIKSIYFSYNAVSWYLADTLFFAVLFPFLFRWIVKATSKGKILIATSLAIIYAIIVIFLPTDLRHAILYISPYIRLTYFIFGIFLALGYLRTKNSFSPSKLSSIIGQFIVILSIVLLVIESCLLTDNTRVIAPVYWPLIAAVIIISSLPNANTQNGFNILENNYLYRLGKLSFPIFLIHVLVIKYTTLIFDKILHFENNIVFVVFTLILTIVISIFVYKYILKSITKWLTQENQPSMTARS